MYAINTTTTRSIPPRNGPNLMHIHDLIHYTYVWVYVCVCVGYFASASASLHAIASDEIVHFPLAQSLQSLAHTHTLASNTYDFANRFIDDFMKQYTIFNFGIPLKTSNTNFMSVILYVRKENRHPIYVPMHKILECRRCVRAAVCHSKRPKRLETLIRSDCSF